MVGKKKIKITHVTPWLGTACTLAGISGHLHDLGKLSEYFNAKIRLAAKVADPVRHEIISALLISRMLTGCSWEQAWDGLSTQASRPFRDLLSDDRIASMASAVLFCVATHHRMLKGRRKPDLSNHVRAADKDDPAGYFGEVIHCCEAQQSFSDLKKIATSKVARIHDFTEHHGNPLYWEGVATVARAGLLLGDHIGSAIISGEPALDGVAWANTQRNCAQPTMKQSLSWHLAKIGNLAGQMVRHMANHQTTRLSAESESNILRRAPSAYQWQDQAAQAAHAAGNAPTLVFNVASTGAGKTLANAKLATTLARAKERPACFSVALNLRTLTMQTRDEYRRALGLQEDELALVMGDHVAMKLRDYQNDDQADPEAREFDVAGSSTLRVDWLESLEDKHHQHQILPPPILVSTADYLVAAGDPCDTAAHSIALTRLMHSDLIVDELDSYDLKGMSAMLRIIRIAAMFGRDVIVSSATIPASIAEQVWEAYRNGHRIYCAMHAAPENFSALVVDNSGVAPTTVSGGAVQGFLTGYTGHINAMQERLRERITKIAKLLPISSSDEAGIRLAIARGCIEMHERNHFEWLGKRISFGLVRIANIKQAAMVAGTLRARIAAESGAEVHRCCYHARHFLIQRFHIERTLDRILCRKGDDPNVAIRQDAEIRELVKASGSRDIMFIVVATPVEEVGRDHDFDWAVIEPSSVHSLVQTAGRVNRHRQSIVQAPNVGILQFNFRHLTAPYAFKMPGLESSTENDLSTHPTHDLATLLSWDAAGQITGFGAGVRFDEDQHPFSHFDSVAIRQHLKSSITPLLENELSWVGDEIYKENPLRESGPRNVKVHFLYESGKWVTRENTIAGQELVETTAIIMDATPDGTSRLDCDASGRHCWLALPIEKMLHLAADAKISAIDALGVTIPIPNDSDDVNASVALYKMGWKGAGKIDRLIP